MGIPNNAKQINVHNFSWVQRLQVAWWILWYGGVIQVVFDSTNPMRQLGRMYPRSAANLAQVLSRAGAES